MVTKSDYGLGPLYHGTSKDSADAILVGGLLVMGRQPIWLSVSQEEASENAQEKEGSPVVLEVNLPEDWLLDRAEAGTYLSWRDIPVGYIKPLEEPALMMHRLKSGSSPHNPKLERTTTDKILDDLERAWHRIENDTSTEMQSALGILKEVMGHYYGDPCITVWDNSDLVGIAVYTTFRHADYELQFTHINELASFTLEPGVGTMLVKEVIKMAREHNSDVVSLYHAPGKKGFYEKLGFGKRYITSYEPTAMTYLLEVEKENPEPEDAREDYDVVIFEHGGNITAHIKGIRATAELSELGQTGVEAYNLGQGNWLWFNRLINQSEVPHIGTVLLDKVLEYSKEKDYSIVNQVSAYGDISQKDLEDWYIRKGFTPVDSDKYGNAFLKWVPR